MPGQLLNKLLFHLCLLLFFFCSTLSVLCELISYKYVCVLCVYEVNMKTYIIIFFINKLEARELCIFGCIRSQLEQILFSYFSYFLNGKKVSFWFAIQIGWLFSLVTKINGWNAFAIRKCKFAFLRILRRNKILLELTKGNRFLLQNCFQCIFQDIRIRLP